jgi:hypothetical protein
MLRRIFALIPAGALLQSALVHINTLLLQTVLEQPTFRASIGPDERRALSPLFWSHINPYGRFELDMDSRLDFAGTSVRRASQ